MCVQSCTYSVTFFELSEYYWTATFRSLGAAELAADSTFCHRSSDQDDLKISIKIAPNDVDESGTSRHLGAE